MPDLNEATILETLKQINYPGFSRDIVSFGLVRSITLGDTAVTIQLAITTSNATVPQQLKTAVEAAVAALPDVKQVIVHVAVTQPQGQPNAGTNQPASQSRVSLPGVQHCIAIASGKGGVGKSTLTVNLACALQQQLTKQNRPDTIAILDADIYGPSIPLMLGIHDQPTVAHGKLQPMQQYGIEVMSMGLLIDETAPVAWRGPMVTKTIQQFIRDVDWQDIAILLVDLPPGTGDAHLTLTQSLALDGAIVVTTPQTVAVQVAQRGAQLFPKVDVSILGVVENMSFLQDSHSGQQQYLFGQGGGQQTADALGVPLLGQIPLDMAIRQGGDEGRPVMTDVSESTAAQAFGQLAQTVLTLVDGFSNTA